MLQSIAPRAARSAEIRSTLQREKGVAIALVFLYRRPILDYWCETGEDLRAVVRHVLIHEIGHHFGFSDADMERIEADE